MRFRKTIIVLTVLVPGLLLALTLKKTSIRELAQTSDLIITGYVISNHSQWNSARDLIFTFSDIEISAVHKGNPGTDIISVKQMGGRIGDFEVQIPGAPILREGSELLMFLVRYKGSWVIHSMVLGKFHIFRDTVAGESWAVHDLYGVNLIAPESGEPLEDSENYSRYPLDAIISEIRSAP